MLSDSTSTYADTFSRLAFPPLFQDVLHIRIQIVLGCFPIAVSLEIDECMTQVHKLGARIVAGAAVVNGDANVMESLDPFHDGLHMLLLRRDRDVFLDDRVTSETQEQTTSVRKECGSDLMGDYSHPPVAFRCKCSVQMVVMDACESDALMAEGMVGQMAGKVSRFPIDAPFVHVELHSGSQVSTVTHNHKGAVARKSYDLEGVLFPSNSCSHHHAFAAVPQDLIELDWVISEVESW